MDASNPESVSFDFHRYGILFVDDEPLALDLFRANFEEEFQISLASSAQEALEIIKNEDIALVLADQRMPGMTGTEFFAEIQKTHPQIIRILVTGFVDFQTVVAAINAGHIYHYVEKPWDYEELRLTLRRGLEHCHILRERDRLQADRIQTLEKMARSNRLAAVGTLAAGIAHEIRNPLSAITTFHQMLPEKTKQLISNPETYKDEFWSKFSNITLGEVERIKKLIQELLDFARDSGSSYHMNSINLLDLIESILPFVDLDFRRKGIVLEKDFPKNFPPVEMDADKIKQVLLNLILNAMHASSEGDKIKIKIQSKDLEKSSNSNPYCQISVIDSGCGIPPENLEQVFDPFFTTREPGVGTGLGLTMCHHIVTIHQGEIHLKSEPGGGTTVKVKLPFFQKKLSFKESKIPGPHFSATPSQGTPTAGLS